MNAFQNTHRAHLSTDTPVEVAIKNHENAQLDVVLELLRLFEDWEIGNVRLALVLVDLVASQRRYIRALRTNDQEFNYDVWAYAISAGMDRVRMAYDEFATVDMPDLPAMMNNIDVQYNNLIVALQGA